VGTDPRRATTPPVLAEAGDVPDGASGRAVGLREQGARGVGGAREGKSEERTVQDEGVQGEMVTVANAEWGGLMAARLCGACDGRVSR
jgi:hypothetical protein